MDLAAILALLRRSEREPYIGEPVSQLEHALQTAAAASSACAAEALVAAALLHDIGHLCAPPGAAAMPGLGIADHERVGAECLRAAGFGEDVVGPVAAHVRAKRYLVAKHPAYRRRLSGASAATLAIQGGAMTDAEASVFEREPGFEDALRLRAWDEQAKVAGWAGPPLASYVTLLERVVRGPSSRSTNR